MSIDEPLASTLAARALANVRTAYPFHLQHLCLSERDVLAPSELHPAFHGSYDWHSCVHMHWTLGRCLRLAPSMATSGEAWSCLATRLTAERMLGELAYFLGAGRESFERPYGWAWLLVLAAELELLARVDARATPLRDALVPLEAAVVDRWLGFLSRPTHAVRVGTHGNSAFALRLAHTYAEVTGHAALARALDHKARLWFEHDVAYPVRYEPSGEDFLSAGLCEAALMRRVLGPAEFSAWWARFAPEPAALAGWLEPVEVADEEDAKLVHLHGLNLSRAFCWRELLVALPEALAVPARAAIEAHVSASLAAATAGRYVSTHWLASFVLLALDGLGAAHPSAP